MEFSCSLLKKFVRLLLSVCVGMNPILSHAYSGYRNKQSGPEKSFQCVDGVFHTQALAEEMMSRPSLLDRRFPVITEHGRKPEVAVVFHPRSGHYNPGPLAELAKWIYTYVQPPSFGPLPHLQLVIDGARGLGLLTSDMEFIPWQGSSELSTQLLLSGFLRRDIPQRRWQSADEIQQYLEEVTASGPLGFSNYVEIARWAFRVYDVGLVSFLTSHPDGVNALIEVFPRGTANRITLWTEAPTEFLQAVLNVLCEHIVKERTRSSPAYQMVVDMLITRLGMEAEFDKPAQELVDFFRRRPSSSNQSVNLQIASASMRFFPDIAEYFMRNSLSQSFADIRKEVPYDQKRNDLLQIMDLLNAIVQYAPRFHGAARRRLSPLIMIYQRAFRDTVHDPDLRRQIYEDFARLIRVTKDFDNEAFAQSLRVLTHAPFPHLQDPEGERVQKTYINTVLSLCAEDPKAYLPLVKTLVAQLQLYPLYERRDEDYPWAVFSFIMNRIPSTQEQMVYRRLASLLFEGFSGNVGTSVSGHIRNISRRGIYDEGLEGFVRGEIHLRYGPSNLELVGHVLTAYRTGDGSDLYLFMRRRGFGHLFEQWEKDPKKYGLALAPASGPHAIFRIHPEIREIFSSASGLLGIAPGQIRSEDLFKLTPNQWNAIRDHAATLRAEGQETLGSAMLRAIDSGDIQLYLLLNQRYSSTDISGLTQRLSDLRLPPEIRDATDRLREFIKNEAHDDILDIIRHLKAAIHGHITAPAAFDPKSIADEEHEQRSQMRNDVSDVVQALKPYYPKDPKFNLLMLDLLLDDIAVISLGAMRDQLYENPPTPSFDRAVSMLAHCLAILLAAGFNMQEMQDLLGFFCLRGETMTHARLRLLSARALGLLDYVLVVWNTFYGDVLDFEIRRLEREQLHPHLAHIEPSTARIKARLHTHVLNQMLFAFPEINTLQSTARAIFGFLRNEGPMNLVQMVFQGATPRSREVYIVNPQREWQLANTPLSPQQRENEGEKGANLIRMARLGPNEPPALIVAIGATYQEAIRSVIGRMAELSEIVRDNHIYVQGRIEPMADHLGHTYGHDMLLSVRSGALFDLPGLLLTITNVGINIDSNGNIAALEKRLGEYGAWDSYRRFVQDYGMAYGIRREEFSQIIEAAKRKYGVESKIYLTGPQMKEIALEYEQFAASRGCTIPHNPQDQLAESIRLVYSSWSPQPVHEYLSTQYMEYEDGTALIVQPMVAGNMRDIDGKPVFSGAGAAYTVNAALVGPGTIEGSFALSADGEDVADGVVTFHSLDALRNANPAVFAELVTWLRIYVNAFGNDVEVEFTVQNGALYFLQARSERPHGRPPRFKTIPKEPLAKGFGLAGGALSGLVTTRKILEDPERYQQMYRQAAAAGTGLILVTSYADPEATYILTKPGVTGFVAFRGGPGQHSQRIAGVLHLTAIAGVTNLTLDPDRETVYFGNTTVHVGDWISIDGDSGSIYQEKLEINEKGANPHSTEGGQIPLPFLSDQSPLPSPHAGHYIRFRNVSA